MSSPQPDRPDSRSNKDLSSCLLRPGDHQMSSSPGSISQPSPPLAGLYLPYFGQQCWWAWAILVVFSRVVRLLLSCFSH